MHKRRCRLVQDLPKSGNRFIDADHEQLAALIRQAGAHLRQDSDSAALANVARDFSILLERHFIVENLIAGGAGFPGTSEHAQRHQEILDQMQDLIGEISYADSTQLRFNVVDRMERVLFDHEMLEDCHYWQAIRDLAEEVKAGRQPAWSQDMAVGVDWLDEQHRALVVLLAEIIASACDAARAEQVQPLMDRFMRAARQHFAEEERHLEAAGKTVTAHRRHHQKLLENLNSVVAEHQVRPGELAADYLTHWLLDHVRGLDRVDFG